MERPSLRYSATRLALRICLLAATVAPAQGQVQVGELIVRQASDGVTVSVAQDDPVREVGVLPAHQETAPELAPASRPAVTRITLNADDLPPAAMQPRSRPLPPLPTPRSHEMERDVLTLKAAYAAMQLGDQLRAQVRDQSRERKLASLR